MAQAKILSLEFLIIVVGVLAALGVDAWYSNVTERRLAEDYLSRIEVELEGVRTMMERIGRGSDRALEESAQAVAFFDGEDRTPDHEEIVQSVYNMGRDLNDAFDLATYSDLISTGRLRLIEDAELRAAIQRAFSAVGRVESMRRPNRQQFQQEVRGWIPQRVIDNLRMDCEGMYEPEWTCPEAEVGLDVAQTISSRWTSDAAVVAFRLRVQGLSALLGTVQSSLEDVEAALSMLDAR